MGLAAYPQRMLLVTKLLPHDIMEATPVRLLLAQTTRRDDGRCRTDRVVVRDLCSWRSVAEGKQPCSTRRRWKGMTRTVWTTTPSEPPRRQCAAQNVTKAYDNLSDIGGVRLSAAGPWLPKQALGRSRFK